MRIPGDFSPGRSAANWIYLSFKDVYIKTGIAQRSNTPMILIATSDISIPAKAQTTQMTDTIEIIKRLKPHNILFFLSIVFLHEILISLEHSTIIRSLVNPSVSLLNKEILCHTIRL